MKLLLCTLLGLLADVGIVQGGLVTASNLVLVFCTRGKLVSFDMSNRSKRTLSFGHIYGRYKVTVIGMKGKVVGNEMKKETAIIYISEEDDKNVNKPLIERSEVV